MRRVLIAALGSAAGLVATPASASLVYNSALSASAQGFGNAPRALTIQGNGTESGCVGVNSNGTINVGSCRGSDAGFMPNGVTPTGGQEVNPLSDNQKYGIPTSASLGIITAADIGILFNATEPSGNGLTLADITLKFYGGTNNGFLGSIDGQQTFSATDIGNGAAGFIFTIDTAQQAYVNAILGQGGTIYMALEATVTGAAGGPESFAIINVRQPTAVPEPATWAMMLLGFGGIGMTMRRKQRRNGALMQVA